MAAFGFIFVMLPCVAIAGFTCFAACRAQRHTAFKLLAGVCLAVALAAALTPVGVLAWLFTL
ncbi:hypothetical protein Sgleb_44130 [Streptomyces glebosus]|uniref:Uncharacterized protein n=1 Tax=Streptomyces glebosus TaxID=249580 RepID=A0A640T267_9ACTN|nr:hypothetical protein [Streptomyces glebosus]GFE16366.1 hypothetical protein Sgleb_44130 [Streptomyces glebosus]GHG64445.1 hypothetical protein GCM10010513_32480 [Streptomyces glebosus]